MKHLTKSKLKHSKQIPSHPLQTIVPSQSSNVIYKKNENQHVEEVKGHVLVRSGHVPSCVNKCSVVTDSN